MSSFSEIIAEFNLNIKEFSYCEFSFEYKLEELRKSCRKLKSLQMVDDLSTDVVEDINEYRQDGYYGGLIPDFDYLEQVLTLEQLRKVVSILQIAKNFFFKSQVTIIHLKYFDEQEKMMYAICRNLSILKNGYP